MDKERIYTPKTQEQIKEEMIKSIEEFIEWGNKFKEWSEEFTFRLAVMGDGIKKYLQGENL